MTTTITCVAHMKTYCCMQGHHLRQLQHDTSMACAAPDSKHCLTFHTPLLDHLHGQCRHAYTYMHEELIQPHSTKQIYSLYCASNAQSRYIQLSGGVVMKWLHRIVYRPGIHGRVGVFNMTGMAESTDCTWSTRKDPQQNYCGISLQSIPGKVYVSVLE